MHRIVVATDFSAPATNAAEYAAQLAKQVGAELTLFHVFKPDVHTRNALVSADTLDHHKVNDERQLADAAAGLQARHGVRVTWEYLSDEPVSQLSAYVAAHAVDLVVMGIQSDLPEYKLFGNTTTAVIKLMQFPLLVVPHGARWAGVQRVVYACDASRVRDGAVLAVMKDLVPRLEAQLEVLHVFEKASDPAVVQRFEQVVDAALAGMPHSYRYATHHRVGAGIQAVLAEFPAQLLVMVSHELSFWEAMTTGSRTRQMTTRTHTPLLVIPGKQALKKAS